MAVFEHLVAIVERLGWLEATMVAEEEEVKACLEKMEASQENIEAMAEHCKWTICVKATYLLTTLQDPASGVLHGDPKGVTYKETTGALEG
jgi:hypothetical protein